METSSVLRGKAARVRSAGKIRWLLLALVVGIVQAAGCMKDIPYDATAEKSATKPSTGDSEPSEETPPLPAAEPEEVDLFANVPVKNGTPPTEVSEPDPAPEPEPADPPAAEPPQSDEDFFDSVFGPRETDQLEPESAPEPEPVNEPDAQPKGSPSSLPAPDAQAEVPLLEAKPMELAEANPVPKSTEEPLLPWLVPDEEEPTEMPSAPPVESPPTAAERMPVAEADLPREVPDVATAAPLERDSAFTQPTPAEPKPIDSRDLTWRLASRLSYLMLAPDTDVASVHEELDPVVAVLDLELPEIVATKNGSPEQLKQLLAVGRELGEEAAAKYDAQHAALVEIAFKSNLLLAVAKERPQLRHGINGSVSAAAVRAGLPESVWQPFQNEVANHDDAPSLTESVLRLHNDVGKYFEQLPVADPQSQPPVLR